MNTENVKEIVGLVKWVIGMAITYVCITNISKETVNYFTNKPPAIECEHHIENSSEPYLFHGKIISSEHCEVMDWQTIVDRPPLKFDAIFARNEAGKIILVYSEYSDTIPSLDGTEITGWFIQSGHQIGDRWENKLLKGYFPINYPILVKQVNKKISIQ